MSIFRITHDPNKPACDPSQNPYLTGKNAGFVFTSDDEVLAAMSTDDYRTNPDYRYAVHVALGRSQGILIQGENRKGLLEAAMTGADQIRALEDQQIVRETIVEKMSDPRYETSILYRREVQEYIAAQEAAQPAVAAITNAAVRRPHEAVRLQATEEDAAAIRTQLAKENAVDLEAHAQDAAQAAYDRAMNGDVGSDDDDSE